MNPSTAENTHISFSAILASTIHDVKNSLGIVLSSLDELVRSVGDSLPPAQMGKLLCESQQVTNNLVQLLALYKMENQGLVLNIDDYFIYDFLEEILISEQALLKTRNIELGFKCAEDLTWYIDRDLITGVLKNALNNALRYAYSKVLITAEEVNHSLVLSVNDDGNGFSDTIMANYQRHGVNFSSGNTGLGIYFSSRVAELHKNRDKQGVIEIGNGHVLGGACFSIILP